MPTSAEQLVDARRAISRLSQPEQPRHRGDVVGDRPVREQADLLDHVADAAPQRRPDRRQHVAAARP